MNLTRLALLTLIPGFVLAACAPTEPASTSENVVEESLEVVESAPAVEVEETLPNVDSPPEAPMPEEAAPAPAEETAPAPAEETDSGAEWVALFDGESLNGWTVRGNATWEVVDGALVGRSQGGQGHIYADPVLTDLEVKGTFRIMSEGKDANSGLYFRANPPADNPDGYPNGYEAQICHTQEAHTGWLWKPGTPTGKAEKLLTKDGEWFDMRVRAAGTKIEIWINEELVMIYEDDEYTQGQIAIQCHNDQMVVEAKNLAYRDLSGGQG